MVNPQQVIHTTLSHVRVTNGLVVPKRRLTGIERIMLERLRIPIKEVGVRRGKWVGWRKPETNKLKLNVDGSRRGQVTTAGGVMRDSNGDFLVGFAVRFTHTDSLRSELEAIWHGLQVCKEFHPGDIEVETDSEGACKMICNYSEAPWRYKYLIRRIRKLMEDGSGIKHIYRQANQVADSLAKYAHGVSSRKVFQDLASITRSTQKLLFIDCIGLPFYRPNCNVFPCWPIRFFNEAPTMFYDQ